MKGAAAQRDVTTEGRGAGQEAYTLTFYAARRAESYQAREVQRSGTAMVL
jgi:hypothetical protein